MARKKKGVPVIQDTSIRHKEAGSKLSVLIEHLRVLVTHDDGSWFAQGLEIDYFAEGTSLNDVQARFERGLEATVDLYVKAYGNADRRWSLRAPDEVWTEFMDSAVGDLFEYRQVTTHDLPAHAARRLPFSGIRYYPLATSKAA